MDEILAVKPEPEDNPVALSYLSWFQAITLADMGAAAEADKRAMKAPIGDAELGSNPDYWDVGRWQYTLIRRFLEQNSPYLPNPSLMGRISQILQT